MSASEEKWQRAVQFYKDVSKIVESGDGTEECDFNMLIKHNELAVEIAGSNAYKFEMSTMAPLPTYNALLVVSGQLATYAEARFGKKA